MSNSDIHASDEYRRAMLKVFTRRALEGALARASSLRFESFVERAGQPPRMREDCHSSQCAYRALRSYTLGTGWLPCDPGFDEAGMAAHRRFAKPPMDLACGPILAASLRRHPASLLIVPAARARAPRTYAPVRVRRHPALAGDLLTPLTADQDPKTMREVDRIADQLQRAYNGDA